MAVPVITPLPTPPVRSDAPADFSSKADALVAALPGLVSETNISAAFVDQRAIDADASATAAAESESAVEADRLIVVARADEVASNTATVVARAGEVAANTQAVAVNTQQVAEDAAAVAAALESVADGPVTSVNGMTGVVTGLLSEEGRQSMDAYTLASAAVTDTLDLAQQQVFRVDASSPRTLAFANEPGADRAMTVVVHISGNSAVTWPSGIDWDSDAAPELGDSETKVVLFWDGIEWSGFVRVAK